MHNNFMLKLIAFTISGLAILPVLADSNANLLKKTPQQADWYQQPQSPHALTQPNVFTVLAPNLTENYSVLTIQTRPFTTVNLQGPYQVEIIGNTQTSSVEISGNQADVYNTLIVTDPETHSISLSEINPLIKTVTVKLMTPVIQVLTNQGNGNVNAKDLNGNAMVVTNSGNGNLFITGQGNFKQITLNGKGNIDINNGLADASIVTDTGAGSIIMQGNYAVKTLTSIGNGNIRIDGINSKGLNVNSQGNGNIVLSGFANLEKLAHSGNGNVFFYWVDSDNATIRATGNGVIGLAGKARQVSALLDGQVVFDGRYLQTDNLQVKTQGSARAKVIAGKQLTAAAGGQSQIFYYNKPKSVLKYTTDGGVVLALP